MKKILAALAIAFLPVLANADGWEWTPKYYGELHVGYGTSSHVAGRNTYIGRAMLGTLQGVELNKYAQVGVGVDGVMLTHYYRGKGLRFAVTAYTDLRGFYPVSDTFAPFLDLGLGASVDVKPSGGASFFCQFGPGFRYRKFNFSCGLQSVGTGKGANTFYVKTGLYF